MQVITEAQVAEVLRRTDATDALRRAFTELGRGRAAVLARSRAAHSTADGQALMVSAMGAVLPEVLGTKVYSTRNGQFQFLISLFDTASGAPLARLEANELTRVRTAATTALAVEALAAPQAAVLAIFGAGAQARAHAEAIRPLRAFERVLVCAR